MAIRHLITPEYPPQPGGVSDYTQQVAESLADAGEEVHVWCPSPLDTPPAVGSLRVHRELGFSPAGLRALAGHLDRFPAPRQILVQWVPHGYGYRSMNLAFCLWLWNRARRRGDHIEIMVHEAFLAFGRSWRQVAAAFVHRLMTIVLLQAAAQVWVSVPECERRWKPYALGRRVAFHWLPIPSNMPVACDASRIQAIRDRYASGSNLLVGHFGTYGPPVVSVLEPILLQFVDESAPPILLLGIGSEQFREQLIRKQPQLGRRIRATGALTRQDVSCHISACDVLIQPYPDGVSTRRTSLMAGASHGKAIVTTSGPSTEPLWDKSGAVALAPAGNTRLFVQRLRTVCSDAAERYRLGQAAAQLYRERFDIGHTLSALRKSASESMLCVS